MIEIEQSMDGTWRWRRGDEMWRGGYSSYEDALYGAQTDGER